MDTKSKKKLIYKYYSPSEYSLDALINRYFWFSRREFLNDPFDLGNFKIGRRMLAMFKRLIHSYLNGYSVDEIEKQIREYASCSFTNDEKNKQMWAYYAKDYSGWCLAFEVEDDMFAQSGYPSPLLPAIYVDKNIVEHSIKKRNNFNDIRFMNTNTKIEEIIWKILCTKHYSWMHEKEERMLTKMNHVSNNILGQKHEWGNLKLHHITIGGKITPAYKNILLTIAKTNGVPVFRIGVSQADFTLKKTKITK